MGLLSPSYRKIMKNRQSISTNCEQVGYQKEIERLKKEKQYLIEMFCKANVQYCSMCENKSCGDNVNKY